MTTQNCAECGTRAEPGQSFCDACGAVLSWKAPAPRAGRTAAPVPSAAVSATAPDGPPRASTREENREGENRERENWERENWEEENTAPTARTGTTGRAGAGAGVPADHRASFAAEGNRPTAYDGPAPSEPAPTPMPAPAPAPTSAPAPTYAPAPTPHDTTPASYGTTPPGHDTTPAPSDTTPPAYD
ncbi:hypothetical protein ACWGIG_28975, partial [Streptomyces sp. NPDC054863]